MQGLGLGSQLLLAAGARALTVAMQVGGVALMIDAKDERAARWYMGLGALRLIDAPETLVLPLGTIARALGMLAAAYASTRAMGRRGFFSVSLAAESRSSALLRAFAG